MPDQALVEPRHQPLLGRIFVFFLILQQDFGPRSGRCVARRDYRITNQNHVVARIAAMRSTMQDTSNFNI